MRPTERAKNLAAWVGTFAMAAAFIGIGDAICAVIR